MAYVTNEIMIKKGYVRAVDAAAALNKALTTIHRWASDGDVKAARDGRALYVLAESLVEMFEREQNEPMAEAARKLLLKKR